MEAFGAGAAAAGVEGLALRAALPPRFRNRLAVFRLHGHLLGRARGRQAQHSSRRDHEVRFAPSTSWLGASMIFAGCRWTNASPALFRAACRMGLEGLVSKRRDRRCEAGSSKHWPTVNRQHPAMERVMDNLR
jgi:hypothetical protein